MAIWSAIRTSCRCAGLGGASTTADRGLQRNVVFLGWPTNRALVIRIQMRGEGGVAGSKPMSSDVHITWHEAQINFGDIPPCLTYQHTKRIGEEHRYVVFIFPSINGKGGFLLDGCLHKETNTVVKHNVRCCYITVDFAKSASQNGVCKTQGKCHKMI